MSRVHSTGPLRLLGFTLKSKTRDDPPINWTEETVYKFMASPQERFYFCWVGPWGRCLVKQINFENQTHNILFKLKIFTLLFRKLNPHKFWIRLAEFCNQTQATCLGFLSFQNWKTVNQLPLLDFAKIENLSTGTTV